MILDRVVGAALEHLSNFGPLVVDDAVHQEENPLLLLVPVHLLDAWVQMVVPSLAALFAHAAVQMLGDERPLLGPIGHDKLEDTPVFFGCPSTFYVEWLAFSSHSLLGQIRGIDIIFLL